MVNTGKYFADFTEYLEDWFLPDLGVAKALKSKGWIFSDR